MFFLPRDLILAALLVVMQTSSGSDASQMPGKPPIAWGSVAIHESDPGREHDNSWNTQPNGITERGVYLSEIISQGYNFSVLPFREEEISGLPDWARKTRYDIVARVDPEDVDAFKKISNPSMKETIAAFTARRPLDEMLMKQSLLVDRFHLRGHWESKERSVYTLSVGKGGLLLKPAADPEHGELIFDRGHLSGKGVPISFIASLLSAPTDRTVLDKTGLTGAYDFDLRFSPEDGAADANTNDANLFTAVQEQLGLKLQSARASVPVFVVDSVERPTPN
jgi:uncharacterized protein (TIGR03435 family)